MSRIQHKKVSPHFIYDIIDVSASFDDNGNWRLSVLDMDLDALALDMEAFGPMSGGEPTLVRRNVASLLQIWRQKSWFEMWFALKYQTCWVRNTSRIRTKTINPHFTYDWLPQAQSSSGQRRPRKKLPKLRKVSCNALPRLLCSVLVEADSVVDNTRSSLFAQRGLQCTEAAQG